MDKQREAFEAWKKEIQQAKDLGRMFSPESAERLVQAALAQQQADPYCYVYTENGEEYFAPPGAYVPEHAIALYAAPAPSVPQGWKLVPPGMMLVPHWKGYALLGTGNYVIEHSADFDPELGAELIIRLATDEDREGGRQIGEKRPTKNPGAPIYPEDMVIRIGFLSERALFALEDQLREIRETHFAAPEAPAPTVPADGRDWSLLEATQESLREHMEIGRNLRTVLKAAREALMYEKASVLEWEASATELKQNLAGDKARIDAAIAQIDALVATGEFNG